MSPAASPSRHEPAGKSFEQRFVAPIRSRLAAERWGWVVCALTLVSALWLYVGSKAAHTPGSDGFYSWIFARSIAFDGDIHFANDYALCGDPFRIGIDRGTGHPDNMFYAGPAVVWVPALWILRLVFFGHSAAATCGHPFSTIVLGLSPIMGAATAYLCYRLARREFSDGIAALAVALLVLGGPILKFASVLPSYSHVHDALGVCALLELTWQAVENPAKTRRWVGVALILTACILQRLSNVAFVAIPITMAISAAQRPKTWAIPVVIVGCGALLGLELQGAIYKYLYGHPLVFSHGPYFMHLAHAHPFLLLFDKEEGLFHFTPTVWLSVIGLYPALRDPRTRPWLIPFCLVAVFETYISSAVLDWSSARRLTNLTPLWVLLACYPLRSLARWLEHPGRSASIAGFLVALPFSVVAIGYAWGVSRGRIPLDRPLSQAELQGGSTTSFLAMIEEVTGSLPVLPAEIAFALRYRMPRASFGVAAYPRWYTRDFRSLRWGQRSLFFSDRGITQFLDGFEIRKGQATPLGSRARVICAVQWPYATHINIRAAGSDGTMMRVGFGRAFGDPIWSGVAKPLSPVMNDVEFVIPEGAFSSGIQEFVMEWSGKDVHDVALQSITLDDRVPRPPPFAH